MKYTIELNKNELDRLKRLVRDELTRTEYFIDTFGKSDAVARVETELLLIAGKLDNIIPVADNITEDTSVLDARKYGLFGRK